jgi:hypothetical protein
MQPCQGGAAEEATAEVPQIHNREGLLLHPRHSRRVLRCSTTRYQTATTEAHGTSGTGRIREADFLAATPQQPTGQSAQGSNVNSLPLDNMLRAITIVQEIMAEFSGAVTKDNKILAIRKILLNLMGQNGH